MSKSIYSIIQIATMFLEKSTNTINNLIPLCRPCHMIAERDKFFNEELKIKLKNKIAEKEFDENGE